MMIYELPMKAIVSLHAKIMFVRKNKICEDPKTIAFVQRRLV